MKVGEKAKLLIRSDYGYGSQSMGAKIPANSNLIFDVELLGFQEKEKDKWEVSARLACVFDPSFLSQLIAHDECRVQRCI